MKYPVVHFEVMGKDPDALQAFYGGAFDWQFAPATGAGGAEYRFAGTQATGGINGGIGAMAGYDGHVTFYVLVPSLEAMLARVEELGGSTLVAPSPASATTRVALFRDPEGHVVGLVEERSEGQS